MKTHKRLILKIFYLFENPSGFSLTARMKAHVLRSDFDPTAKKTPLNRILRASDLPAPCSSPGQSAAVPPRQGLGAPSISGRLLDPVPHFWEEEAAALCPRQHLPMISVFQDTINGWRWHSGLWWQGGDQSPHGLGALFHLHHSVRNLIIFYYPILHPSHHSAPCSCLF